ncbi:MAG TPA: hypothetical protein VE291_03760 [Terracidiphilus sp.]|nr:hypothetical protein [Terracidiphilus sp.]
MPISIPSGLTDDNDFVVLIRKILHAVITVQDPNDVWIIQIDNWFDHKWLNFSGNGAVANWMFAGVPTTHALFDRLDSVKKAFHQSKATFPPFSPGRLLGQWSYLKSGEDYTEFPIPTLPHKTKKIQSRTNLQRRIKDFSAASCFFWFSGNTLKNGRGSLMAYVVEDGKIGSWYAGFSRDPDWTITQTKGISREDLLRLTRDGPIAARGA